MSVSKLKQSLARRRLLFEASFCKFEYLWSKYYPFLCDGNIRHKHVFDSTERLLTKEQWQSCYDPEGTIFWVKLGSYRNGHPNNLSGFVEHVLPNISRSFTLVTTDGDSSVPNDLSEHVLHRLLEHPNLVAWYTQNLADKFHPKLHSIPIGLDLHTDRGFGVGIKLLTTFRTMATQPSGPRLDRVLVDFAASCNSDTRRGFIAANASNSIVDVLPKPITQLELWKMYRRYRWVVSLPGNGLDCHRTWEAGYLGATVLVANSILSELHDQNFIKEIDPFSRIDPDSLLDAPLEETSDQLVNILNRKFIFPLNSMQ